MPYVLGLALLLQSAAIYAEQPASKDAQQVENAESTDTEKDAVTDEADRLRKENLLAAEQLKQALAESRAEIDRLETEHRLRQLKLKDELLETELEVERLKASLALADIKNQQANQAMKAENERIGLELARAQALEKQKLAKIEAEKNRLAAERLLQDERVKAKLSELEQARNELALRNLQLAEQSKTKELELKALQTDFQTKAIELDLQNKELLTKKVAMESELVALNVEIEKRNKQQTIADQVGVLPPYPEEPFSEGVLTISDRRIPMNEPIIRGTANYVTERIHFYNNQSKTAPIFIVIDSCPGGSVMEGYRILKAMEGSEAPIHVLVKSFAASMAAVITSMADHSYAYPNAIILHHQPSGGSYGNVTQQGEQYEVMQEWARRLHKPVADKIGIGMDEFYQQMYENNSDGDWMEFADVANSLKWVDHVVSDVREEGILKRPTSEAPRPWYFFFASDGDEKRMAMEKDKQGFPDKQILPQLQPFDFYFIHNPTGYYSW